MDSPRLDEPPALFCSSSTSSPLGRGSGPRRRADHHRGDRLRTGQFAAQGSAIHQGVALAVEEANGRGGIAGRPLALLSRDDEGKPQRAVAAAEELTGRDGGVALVGGYVDNLVGPIA